MENEETTPSPGVNFHLSKWFLDFTGENGEAMIFYAAKLSWYGFSASYTSWLRYDPGTGVHLKTRFSKVQFPKLNGQLISWNDPKFGVSGTWEALAASVQARIFDSEEGYLDWKCHQPASKVQLRINDRVLEGRGYAEQLILTVPPWKLDMDELRWGRFCSAENNMVWIGLNGKEQRQWLWLNGEKTENCILEEDCITIPDKNLIVNLDRGVTLEAEKKIFNVVGKLIRYIPGLNKVIPVSFLMADEHKWLSRGQLQKDGKILSEGMAIHELVNFKPDEP